MKIFKNETGVTLMELLAAIIIFMMFGAIVWAFFFQSLKFNEAEVSKQQLKTEANLIINAIQQNHVKKPESYRISTIDSNSKLVITNIDNGIETIIHEFNQPGMKYKLYCKKTDDGCLQDDEITYLSNIYVNNKDFPFRLEISSSTNEKIRYQLETAFSRISQ